ncbi:uncharacterized protein KY384_005847 [Bacidia gigantensis]|uniref:uncharacterized protein n=1 Tax=Bacidia gigantensis TaxID=2732470 RepID=UPI001D055622|nr:uncharacterized protein KY384_005847 [Bacidia gigantensis]KAG8529212.1 hypothetical protein KY384_005847 [Bacidia gigantensis]
MNGLYHPQKQYSAEDLHSYAGLTDQQNAMLGLINANGGNGMVGTPMDQMIQENEKDLHRRRSFSNQNSFGAGRPMMDQDPQRSSMMEFGSLDNHELDGFQFNPGAVPAETGMQRPGNIAQRRLESQQRARRHMSHENLALNTTYANMPSYQSLNSASPYGQPINSGDPMSGFDLSSDYMMMGMNFSPNPMDNNHNGAATPQDSYLQNNFATQINDHQMQRDMTSSMSGRLHDPGGGPTTTIMADANALDKVPIMRVSDQMRNTQSPPQTIPIPNPNPGLPINSVENAHPQPGPHGLPTYNPSQKSQAAPNLDVSTDGNGVPFQGQNNAGKQVVPMYKNAYSSSGFDMLGVLMRVAARPNPQINIGAVDMSCAFVVCDVTQHDLPIVYCSDVFERLTAYTRHEILGRNCRFLQSPDGKIQAGVQRKYVDDKSVLRIKNMITERREAQISVINYRKGGQPFMNLLTMIPIAWDTDEIKYYVGFQVDLVEQPTSITNKNPDGSYTINYQRGLLPRYVVPEAQKENTLETGQTVNRDDVSTVLSTIGSEESELSKRIWDKVLLENTDDVVHVLSLKGLFLYLSPSSRKVLEYDSSELVGTPLSSVCHPSDIVPVTRELKDTSTGAAVNVVFRIRRKHNGYTWFESHGSLHLEQGKGRKCIIMVGRERPVYALARADVMTDGGFGESELWTKMSTSGMFLFVSSNVRSLLDRQPEDLIGTSAQALMRQESRLEFMKKLEVARTGVKATFKHDVENKRGQVLQAQTTIYPGDAAEGQKPTFLVAQTRLLKLSRNKQSSNASPQVDNQSVSPTSSASALSGGQGPTPSATAGNHPGVTTQAGGAGLSIGTQHEALASEDNVFDELKTTRSTSWQFELRQMEKRNRLLAEELQSLLSSKKKRKRRNGAGNMQKDCANCHTRVTPEWRRGPSGNRDLCNSCGLRWAKEVRPRLLSSQLQQSRMGFG